MSRLALASLMVAASVTTGAAAPGESGLAQAKQAAVSLQRGRADHAVQLYTAALQDPTLSNDRRAAVLNDRGVAYTRLNKARAAIEDFNRSIQLAPEVASAYNNRGNVLLALGFAAEAEKDFDRALLLVPGYVAAYINRANARAIAGDQEGAMRDFTQAVRLSPKSPAAYGGMARVHLQYDRPHAAIRDLNRAVANDPRYGPGYRVRAEANVLIGRFESAIEDLSRAITFDGTNAELFTARGYAHLAVRNTEAAIKDFQRGAELSSRSSAAVEGLALAQAKSGAFDAALDSLSKALEIDPRSAQAYAYRAIVYKLMGQGDLGGRDIDRATRLDPKRPEVLWAKAEILELSGERTEAVTALRAAVSGRPHLREAVQALERLGADVAIDAEAKDLAFDRWRVFVRSGRHYTTNAEYPRLSVPLEMMSPGAPRIVEFEVKGGAQAGLGILRFVAGKTSGGEEIEHGAVIDLAARSVLAVETMRQGTRRASWAWGEDTLTVTGLDGFKQEYSFRSSDRDVATGDPSLVAPTPAPQARARRRPAAESRDTSWIPWSQNYGNPSPSRRNGQRNNSQKPKSLFDLLFN